MNPRPPLSPLILLVALSGATFCSLAAPPPNVLFFAVDDLRPELGCYGQSHIHSPNLDALAARGTVFDRAYCQQAVCSPSRTSLLTGLRPDTTRIYDLETHFRDTIPDAVTLPQHFLKHGYHTVGMGKIFHGSLNDDRSWSEWQDDIGGSLYALPESQQLIAARRQAARQAGKTGKALQQASKGPPTERADVSDAAYVDGALAERAVQTLGKLKERGSPFFLAVGFHRPHLPFNAPSKYWALYDPSKIELADNPFAPKNAPDLAGTTWGELRAYEGMPQQGPLADDQALLLRHAYYASVSFTDANVGKVLTELKRLGLEDNTLVVLWGDHGWKLGEHGMWCKHTNFELDAHAPLLIVDPRCPVKGSHSSALVEFVDIYPTLCDLAGLPKPAALEGTSLAPLLTNPGESWKRAAFSQYPRRNTMGYSMKTDTARLTLWLERTNPGHIVATELYDHSRDPAENLNVAEDPNYAEQLKRLMDWHREGWSGTRAALAR